MKEIRITRPIFNLEIKITYNPDLDPGIVKYYTGKDLTETGRSEFTVHCFEVNPILDIENIPESWEKGNCKLDESREESEDYCLELISDNSGEDVIQDHWEKICLTDTLLKTRELYESLLKDDAEKIIDTFELINDDLIDTIDIDWYLLEEGDEEDEDNIYIPEGTLEDLFSSAIAFNSEFDEFIEKLGISDDLDNIPSILDAQQLINSMKPNDINIMKEIRITRPIFGMEIKITYNPDLDRGVVKYTGKDLTEIAKIEDTDDNPVITETGRSEFTVYCFEVNPTLDIENIPSSWEGHYKLSKSIESKDCLKLISENSRENVIRDYWETVCLIYPLFLQTRELYESLLKDDAEEVINTLDSIVTDLIWDQDLEESDEEDEDSEDEGNDSHLPLTPDNALVTASNIAFDDIIKRLYGISSELDNIPPISDGLGVLPDLVINTEDGTEAIHIKWGPSIGYLGKNVFGLNPRLLVGDIRNTDKNSIMDRLADQINRYIRRNSSLVCGIFTNNQLNEEWDYLVHHNHPHVRFSLLDVDLNKMIVKIREFVSDNFELIYFGS